MSQRWRKKRLWWRQINKVATSDACLVNGRGRNKRIQYCNILQVEEMFLCRDKDPKVATQR